MTKPNPDHFGLSQADLDSIAAFYEQSESIPGLQWMDRFLEKIPGLIGGLLFWTILWPFFLIALLLSPITRFFFPLKHAKEEAFLRYSAACEEYLKKQESFWRTMSGLDFEHALAEIFSRHGYDVSLTKSSGDEGVDISLRKDNRIGIVQCKRWGKPVGVSVLRDVLGTRIAHKADFAIVACTGGFTRPARTFAQQHAISLLTLENILKMNEK
jgi:hypothetical protein